MYKFKDGERVNFQIGTALIGTGLICGVATIEFPVIGHNYIVEIIESNIDRKIYPFSCCVIPEIHLAKAS